MTGLGRPLLGLALALAMTPPAVAAAASTPLTPEGSIELPSTAGRIDHLAVDVGRKHLFVAELGNGTVDVIDLASRKVIHRITGLKEPQGLAFVPGADVVAVASGGDGTLRLYAAADFAPRGVLKLGDDADNVRLDGRSGNLVIGYGGGALAIVDPVGLRKVRDIALPGHPESFRLEGRKAFINIPDARQIALADLDSGKITGTWPTGKLAGNFPMILDDEDHVAVVFRSPARLVLFDKNTGRVAADIETCGDADDVFFDAARHVFYVSCGSGAIDVIGNGKDGLKSMTRVKTTWGTRTSLFVRELDRLFLAQRAGLLGDHASVGIFRPAP